MHNRIYITTFFILLVLGIGTGGVAQSSAVDLIGGHMTYACVEDRADGLGVFKLTLKVKRNCFGQGEFEPFANVRVFPGNGQDHFLPGLPHWYQLPRDTVFIVDYQICAVTCDTLCIEEAIYETEIRLPPCPGGYIFAYQRCCLDDGLDNIYGPSVTGTTYYVHITEEAFEACNNSPVFPPWTTYQVCTDASYQVDLSATEVDGDSLSYRLYTPRNGASPGKPRPITFDPPPYDAIEWSEPYSEENVLGGSQSLQIDPASGVVTFEAGDPGKYLIGVEVVEWRNGDSLTTIRGDYSIDVCLPDSCRAPRDTICVCYNTEVYLLDQLSSFYPGMDCMLSWTPDDELYYDVGDVERTNPKWLARQSQTFTVVAKKGTRTDTGYVQVLVDEGPAVALPDSVYLVCRDSCFTISADPLYTYQWDPPATIVIRNNDLQFRFCESPVNQWYRVTITSDVCRLDGYAGVKCTLVDSVYLDPRPRIRVKPDCICPGDTSEVLINNPVACYTYSWTPAEGLIVDPANPAQARANPTVTTVYTVTASNGWTETVDSVKVEVLKPVEVGIKAVGVDALCNGQAILTGESLNAPGRVRFAWSMDPTFEQIASTEDTFRLETTSDTIYVYLTATGLKETNKPFCGSDTARIRIVAKNRTVEETFEPIDTCASDLGSAAIVDPTTGLPIDSVLWSTGNPANFVNPEDRTANPVSLRGLPGQQAIIVYYETTFKTSCNVSDSIRVPLTGSLKLSVDQTLNTCGDTVIFKAVSAPLRANTSFAWYDRRPDMDGARLLGTDSILVLEVGDLNEIYLTGSAFWCSDTTRVPIARRPKITRVIFRPVPICGLDTASLILVPVAGDLLSTVWETNGDLLSANDTLIQVVARPGMDSLSISYQSSSRVCPGVVCDSLIVIHFEPVFEPEPLVEKLPCAFALTVAETSRRYQSGQVRWTVLGTNITSTKISDTLYVASSGTYQVVLSPGPDLKSCRFNPDTLAVFIPEYVRLIPNQDTIQLICADPATPEDSTYILSVSTSIDTLTVTWIGPNGEVIGQGLTITVNPYLGIREVLAISGPDACACRDTVRFRFETPNCNIRVDGNSKGFCMDAQIEGISAALECDGVLIGGLWYEWSSDALIVAGADSSHPIFQSDTSFEATVMITDTVLGCRYDTTFVIHVRPPARVEIDVAGPPFLCNGLALLVGSISDTTGSRFQWSYTRSFDPIAGSGPNLLVESEADTVAVYLSAVARDSMSCFCGANVDSIILVNKTLELEPRFEPVDTCVSDRTTVALLDVQTGEPVDSVLWRLPEPGNLVNPSDTSVNPLELVALPGQAEITVIYETFFTRCCNQSDTLRIPVMGDWSVSIDTTLDFCSDSVTLRAVGRPYRPIRNYIWYDGHPNDAGSRILSTDSLYRGAVDDLEEVFLVGDAFWCSDTASVHVDRRPKILNVSVTPLPACGGDDVEVVLTPYPGDTLTTTWETDGEIIEMSSRRLLVRTGKGMDSLRISYRSASLICSGIVCDTLFFVPLDSIRMPDPRVEKIPCTYSARVFELTGNYEDGEVMWTVLETGATSMNVEDIFVFPAPGQYNVVFGPTPGLINCRFEPDTLSVIIPEFVQLFSEQDSIINICSDPATAEDSIYTLTVTSTIDTLDVFWLNPAGEVISLGNQFSVNPYVGIEEVWAVSGPDGCFCSDTLRFRFIQPRCQIVLVTSDPNVCADKEYSGLTASLNCGGVEIENVAFEWTSGGNIVTGANTASPVFKAGSGFTVDLVITDLNSGCLYDTSIMIDVLPPPPAAITCTPEKILEGQSITLTVNAGTTADETYLWSTGATSQIIVVSPPDDGATYSVTITDASGCCSEAIKIVDPLPCLFDVPTAFSPNDDDMNEFFRVRSSCPLVDFEMKIINRWGEEVFFTEDQEPGWDGTSNRVELPPDVYAYCIILRCPNENETRTLIGNVSLLR